MAFKKNINDLLGILTLMVLALPSIVANIDCNGKPFHCVNSTHFMICVDLGSGVSSTIDDFVIPCPPTTVCLGTNRFECEFPVVTTTVAASMQPLETTRDLSEMNVAATVAYEVTTSIPFEEYFNTVGTTTLSEDNLRTQPRVTESTIITDGVENINMVKPQSESNSTLNETNPNIVDSEYNEQTTLSYQHITKSTVADVTHTEINPNVIESKIDEIKIRNESSPESGSNSPVIITTSRVSGASAENKLTTLDLSSNTPNSHTDFVTEPIATILAHNINIIKTINNFNTNLSQTTPKFSEIVQNVTIATIAPITIASSNQMDNNVTDPVVADLKEYTTVMKLEPENRSNETLTDMIPKVPIDLVNNYTKYDDPPNGTTESMILHDTTELTVKEVTNITSDIITLETTTRAFAVLITENVTTIMETTEETPPLLKEKKPYNTIAESKKSTNELFNTTVIDANIKPKLPDITNDNISKLINSTEFIATAETSTNYQGSTTVTGINTNETSDKHTVTTPLPVTKDVIDFIDKEYDLNSDTENIRPDQGVLTNQTDGKPVLSEKVLSAGAIDYTASTQIYPVTQNATLADSPTTIGLQLIESLDGLTPISNSDIVTSTNIQDLVMEGTTNPGITGINGYDPSSEISEANSTSSYQPILSSTEEPQLQFLRNNDTRKSVDEKTHTTIKNTNQFVPVFVPANLSALPSVNINSDLSDKSLFNSTESPKGIVENMSELITTEQPTLATIFDNTGTYLELPTGAPQTSSTVDLSVTESDYFSPSHSTTTQTDVPDKTDSITKTFDSMFTGSTLKDNDKNFVNKFYNFPSLTDDIRVEKPTTDIVLVVTSATTEDEQEFIDKINDTIASNSTQETSPSELAYVPTLSMPSLTTEKGFQNISPVTNENVDITEITTNYASSDIIQNIAHATQTEIPITIDSTTEIYVTNSSEFTEKSLDNIKSPQFPLSVDEIHTEVTAADIILVVTSTATVNEPEFIKIINDTIASNPTQEGSQSELPYVPTFSMTSLTTTETPFQNTSPLTNENAESTTNNASADTIQNIAIATQTEIPITINSKPEIPVTGDSVSTENTLKENIKNVTTKLHKFPLSVDDVYAEATAPDIIQVVTSAATVSETEFIDRVKDTTASNLSEAGTPSELPYTSTLSMPITIENAIQNTSPGNENANITKITNANTDIIQNNVIATQTAIPVVIDTLTEISGTNDIVLETTLKQNDVKATNQYNKLSLPEDDVNFATIAVDIVLDVATSAEPKADNSITIQNNNSTIKDQQEIPNKSTQNLIITQNFAVTEVATKISFEYTKNMEADNNWTTEMPVASASGTGIHTTTTVINETINENYFSTKLETGITSGTTYSTLESSSSSNVNPTEIPSTWTFANYVPIQKETTPVTLKISVPAKQNKLFEENTTTISWTQETIAKPNNPSYQNIDEKIINSTKTQTNYDSQKIDNNTFIVATDIVATLSNITPSSQITPPETTSTQATVIDLEQVTQSIDNLKTAESVVTQSDDKTTEQNKVPQIVYTLQHLRETTDNIVQNKTINGKITSTPNQIVAKKPSLVKSLDTSENTFVDTTQMESPSYPMTEHVKGTNNEEIYVTSSSDSLKPVKNSTINNGAHIGESKIYQGKEERSSTSSSTVKNSSVSSSPVSVTTTIVPTVPTSKFSDTFDRTLSDVTLTETSTESIIKIAQTGRVGAQAVNAPNLSTTSTPKALDDKTLFKTEVINVSKGEIINQKKDSVGQASLSSNDADVDFIAIDVEQQNAPILGIQTQSNSTHSGISVIPVKSMSEQSEKSEGEAKNRPENLQSKQTFEIKENPEVEEKYTKATEANTNINKKSVNDNVYQSGIAETGSVLPETQKINRLDNTIKLNTQKMKDTSQSTSNIEVPSIVKTESAPDNVQYIPHSNQNHKDNSSLSSANNESIRLNSSSSSSSNQGENRTSIQTSAVQTKHNSKNLSNTSVPALKSQVAMPSGNFVCDLKNRGRYSDNKDCKKFYICIGKSQPIHGFCPNNTVFSEIRKQCTKNLSHCIRNNQFQCVSEGRFSDYLNDNIYYICVKNNVGTFIRFKLQCQGGYHLNKTSVRCVLNSEAITGSDTSKNSEQSVSSSKSEKADGESTKIFECRKSGRFPDPKDCRTYYVCTNIGKSQLEKKVKKCDSDEIFHKDKKKCVDADSYEC